MGDSALDLRGIVKRFGAALALDGADLSVRAGSIHALLGENGAGKTTLMRVAYGMLRPDAGEVRVRGDAVTFRSPADALAAGIGMVHQHFTLVPAMTVAENVALGGHGRYRATTARVRVRSVARRVGSAFTVDPDARVADLGVSAQQRVEIVKALARDVRVLVLDEPTAVLTPGESRDLFAQLRAFVAGGGAVVLITHKLRDALELADDVTVLRRGRTVLAARAAAVDQEGLAAAMLGAATAPARPGESQTGTPPHAADVVLAVRRVTVRDARGVTRLRDVSLEVRGGEIVGVAAVEGSGQSELLRLLAGRLEPGTGAVVRPANVGFIPEDRLRDALILPLSLTENVALRGAGTRRGTIAWATIAAHTRALVTVHDVRAPNVASPVGALSGGNQQKLVLARELDGDTPALVAESPTRGLDIAATAAVHRRLRAARDAGAAVVLYSPDLDEVLTLTDRVVVVHAGELRELPHDRDVIGRAMLGAW